MTHKAPILVTLLFFPACQPQAVLPAPPVTFEIIGGPQNVFVKGFCRLEFERNALYASREDAVAMRADRAYWLGVDRPVPVKWAFCDGQTVIVNGDFDAFNSGHFGAYRRGALINIRSINPASDAP